MEIRQFRYVNAVAECGSITKAAARLFISQPALSNYISKLEEELGTKLFDRTTSPLTLTYAGEQYLKRARNILIQLDDMKREFRDISDNLTGRLRVGFPSERIIYMLPQILPVFKAQYPGIDVEVMSGPGNQLTEALRCGKVDFVFLPVWEKEKDIAQIRIGSEELVLVTARGYLDDTCLLDREAGVVDWKRVADYPFITLKKGHALRKSVDVLFKNTGKEINILLESHSNMLSYRLAAQGLGVAVVPELTMKLMQDSMEVDWYHLSKHPVLWEVFALYREGGYIGEVEQAFLDIAVQSLNP